MEKKTEVMLTIEKDCKGSVRFDNKEAKSVLSSIYINRIFAPINSAKKVKVTIEVIE